VVEVLAQLDQFGRAVTGRLRLRAMSSTYCVQLEYPPHADVVNTAARRTPLSRMAPTASST
jgi:hypothetical protein